jgi:hypothetical protein
MLQTDQYALRRILLQQSAVDFRVFTLPSREPLSKHRALQLLESGKTFVFKTNKSGTAVKWIQAIDTAPEYPTLPPPPNWTAKFEYCYRTQFAALFPVSPGYGI